MTLRYVSTAVSTGDFVTPDSPVWNTAPGQAGGSAAAVGDIYCLDRGVSFDYGGFDLGESGPMRPRVAPTASATGGGSTGGALAAGAYKVAYSWVSGDGKESPESPFVSLTVAAGNVPRVTIPAAPHPGIVGARVYLSAAGGALGTFARHSTSDVVVSLTAGGTYDLAAGRPPGSAAPYNGAIRLTHSAARLKPSAVGVVRGDILDARSGSTGKQWVYDPTTDGINAGRTRFDASASAGGTENVYGVHFGIVGTRGGLRAVGTVRANPRVAATRPGIEAAGGGTWRVTVYANGTPTGDFQFADAEVTDYSEYPIHKTANQGTLTQPPQVTTIATSGGTAGTGTLQRATGLERYRVAYSYVDSAGRESMPSPLSAFFAPASSGAIPRVTLPEAVPAGVAYVHLYVLPEWVWPGSAAHPTPMLRYRSYVPVTVGATPVIDLNAGFTYADGVPRASWGIAVGVWNGGEEASARRTIFRRGMRIGAPSGVAPAGSCAVVDDQNLYEAIGDAPQSWNFLNAPGTGAHAYSGSCIDTPFGLETGQSNQLTIGTDADPVWLSNWAPVVTLTNLALAAGARAFNRCSRSLGSSAQITPGDMLEWVHFLDGIEGWDGTTRSGGSGGARAIQGFQGYTFQPGIPGQQISACLWCSAGADGTGSLVATIGRTPTSATDWEATRHVVCPDLFLQDRGPGDIQAASVDPSTQRTGVHWAQNVVYRGPAGDPQAFAVNAANTFAGLVKTFAHNIGWGPPGTNAVVLCADLHGVGPTTAAVFATPPDDNAGFNLWTDDATSFGTATVHTAQASYDLRDETTGGVAPDQRGGAGPLRDDAQFRWPWRNPVTFYWREAAVGAVGATSPTGSTISDGSAPNGGSYLTSTITKQDVRDALDYLKDHWYDRPYVSADGSFANVFAAFKAYVRAGVAPTAPTYAPAANDGVTPGAVDYVAVTSGTPAAYRRHRRTLVA